ncbi:tyrosine-type recombinase/integrase [Vibrio chagasii]|uniref:tyrosine-type recombinase/integrase n=1 Tax=Vibrio chagasii TaxID=170679 RepID=UPI003DA18943
MTKQEQNKPKTEYYRIKDGLAIRKLPQTKNWGIYLKLPGQKRLQFSLKTPDKELAIEKAREHYTINKYLLEQGEPIRQPKQRVKLHTIINELINEYEKLQKAAPVRENKTVRKGKEKYATELRYFKRYKAFYSPDMLVEQLTFEEIQGYFLSLEKAISKNTRTKYNHCFKKIQERAFDKKLITQDQIIDLKRLNVEIMPCTPRDALSEEEINLIINTVVLRKKVGKAKHTDTMLVAYLTWLNFTGMRPGDECLELQWQDISINNHGDLYCIVNGGKTANYAKNKRKVVLDTYAVAALIFTAKAKYSDLIKDLNDYGAIELLTRVKGEEFVFASHYSDTPSYAVRFNELIEYLRNNEGLTRSKNITLYSFRHSYITRAIENNVPLALIAEICGTGLKSIENHYSHITTMSEASRKYLLSNKVMLEELDREKKKQWTEEELQKEKESLFDALEKQFR